MAADDHRLDIQGLRAVAVIAVVLFHAGGILPGGYIGVDVFFVISGCVIGGMLARELQSSGTVKLARFYARRARRLLPAFSLVAVCTLLASIVVLSPTGTQQRAAKNALSATGFVNNVYQYLFGTPYFNPARGNPFLHMWTLSLEEQIYVVVPVFIAGLWWLSKRSSRPRIVVFGVVLATVSSLALCLVAAYFPQSIPFPTPRRFVFLLPFARFWEFGVGLLVALLPARALERPRWSLMGGAVGVASLAVPVAVFDAGTRHPGVSTLVPVLGTALLIRLADTRHQWTKVLSHRRLVWVGDRSYEWYLWHLPFIVMLTLSFGDGLLIRTVAIACSLWMAHFTHRMLSQPLRRNDAIVGLRALRLAAACALPVVVGSGVLIAGANRGWGVASLREVQQIQKRSHAEIRGCDITIRREGCVIDDGPEGLLVLVGDSHADSISDVVRAQARGARMGFGSWTRHACPFMADAAVVSGDGCARWTRDVISWLATVHPRVVVIHMSTNAYTMPGRVRDAEGRPIADHDAAVARFVSGLADTAGRIADLGPTVMVVEDTPTFKGTNILDATLLSPRAEPVTLDRDVVFGDQAALRREVARQFAPRGIVFVPTLEGICPADPCSDKADVWLYRDSHHLSHEGARRALGQFARALSEAVAR